MMKAKSDSKKYNVINGLRAISCIAIIMIHVATNGIYQVDALWYKVIVPNFSDFVFVFMVISAFAMCCGYLEKVQNGDIRPVDFYKRRYIKTLPFFLMLIFLDLLLNYKQGAVPEALADVTLLYGLFPNSIEVIGVGWFLGLVFAFYFIFPFYSALFTNKITAWVSFGISLLLNYYAITYFELDRNNIVYSLCYFMAGGLIYIYRHELENISSVAGTTAVLVSIILYHWIGGNTITRLLFAVSFVGGSISLEGKRHRWILDNAFFNFVGEISMEIYLAHMLVFRGFSIIGLDRFFSNGLLEYIFFVGVVFAGTIIFVVVARRLLSVIKMYGLGKRKYNQ